MIITGPSHTEISLKKIWTCEMLMLIQKHPSNNEEVVAHEKSIIIPTLSDRVNINEELSSCSPYNISVFSTYIVHIFRDSFAFPDRKKKIVFH